MPEQREDLRTFKTGPWERWARTYLFPGRKPHVTLRHLHKNHVLTETRTKFARSLPPSLLWVKIFNKHDLQFKASHLKIAESENLYRNL